MSEERRGGEFEDIAAMTFEQAMAELEDIVQRLERGEIGLEEAIAAYARGAALKRHCDGKLRLAEQRVSRIAIADDGAVSGEPLDDPAGTSC